MVCCFKLAANVVRGGVWQFVYDTKGQLTPMRCNVVHRVAVTSEICQGMQHGAARSGKSQLFQNGLGCFFITFM